MYAKIKSNLQEEYKPLKLCLSSVLNWMELNQTHIKEP